MLRFLDNIEFLIEVKEMRHSALFSRFLKETSNEGLQHSLLNNRALILLGLIQTWNQFLKK